jgi:P-type Ca2+ transporter type 2C
METVSGLSEAQVKDSRNKFGSNELVQLKTTSATTLIVESLKNPMIGLLLSIAALALIFGKLTEALVMIFVVIAYIVVEFINKFRAARIMARLKALTQPTAKVIRDGKIQEIPTSEIVVGDLILLSAGALVPADAQIIEEHGLLVNEASLTGESFPIRKKPAAKLTKNNRCPDRDSCVFSGTTILDGEAKAIVFAVGKESEFGKIAQQVQASYREQTTLQASMVYLSKVLASIAVIASLVIPVIGFIRGFDFQQMVLTWLALTFLMIPGQPPIIITMALALASFGLARKKVIAKRLQGIENLGLVTTILTDKTGTITENKMYVEKFILPEGSTVTATTIPQEIIEKIALTLPQFSTDPTDQAVSKASRARVTPNTLKIVSLEGFTRNHPWRIITYKQDKQYIHAIAGQPEALIAASNLTNQEKEDLADKINQEAALGKRVISFGLLINSNPKVDQIQNISFLALAILIDPIREGVKEAIYTLKEAGIETYIVTGDHKATTQTIGEKVGLGSEVITGSEIESMNDRELEHLLSKVHLCARVNPLDKLRLVKLLQHQGKIVAAIGDGVNDAPAIKAANVGIAMGKIGTDLAKEIADLILTDDNYVHVLDAIKIGRQALDNFRKGLTYYLSAKAILFSSFLIALLFNVPFPLAPIHLILIELIMDLASSTIFVTEQPEPDILCKKSYDIKHYLTWSLILPIARLSVGLLSGMIMLYLWVYYTTSNLILARTCVLVTWLLGSTFLAINVKQDKTPLLVQGIFSNTFALFWLICAVGLSLALTHIPFLFPYTKTTYIPLTLWLGILALSIISTFWIEVKKIIGYYHE